MVDIKPNVLPVCDCCCCPVEENSAVWFAYRLGPEDSHIDVTEVVQFTRHWFEVFINKPELVLWVCLCEECRSSPQSYRGCGHELYEADCTGPCGISDC